MQQTIAQLAGSVGTDLLFARGKTSLEVESLDHMLNTANVTAPLPVVIHRQRNTWLARHIVAGVPLPSSCPGGLLTLQHHEDLLKIDRLVQITTGSAGACEGRGSCTSSPNGAGSSPAAAWWWSATRTGSPPVCAV